MGGMDGFGQVVREPNEPIFHADWERRAYALLSFAMRLADSKPSARPAHNASRSAAVRNGGETTYRAQDTGSGSSYRSSVRTR